MMAENLAEEEGLKAIPREGHEPHDHSELMFRFCQATGLSDAEIRNMKMTPAWWARSLYYYNTAVVEPIGVVLAMQTTQETQMPGLIGEVLLPAFEKHYGFKRTAREIEFFAEHHAADVEHSRRQGELRAKYLILGARGARSQGRRRDLHPALGVDYRPLPAGGARREGDSAAGSGLTSGEIARGLGR